MVNIMVNILYRELNFSNVLTISKTTDCSKVAPSIDGKYVYFYFMFIEKNLHLLNALTYKV